MSKIYILIFSISFINSIFSQEEAISANDKLCLLENLPINNGLSYENKFWNTATKESQFLFNEYTKSTISYDGKLYYNVLIKIDLLNNQILYKPEFSTITEISLINEHIDYLIINKRVFKKIILFDETLYAEENKINNHLLYTRYKKKIQEDLSDQNLKYRFFNDQEFFLSTNGNIFPIKSKKNLLEIFPEKKKEINSFYRQNSVLKSTNPIYFYSKLLKETITM